MKKIYSDWFVFHLYFFLKSEAGVHWCEDVFSEAGSGACIPAAGVTDSLDPRQGRQLFNFTHVDRTWLPAFWNSSGCFIGYIIPDSLQLFSSEWWWWRSDFTPLPVWITEQLLKRGQDSFVEKIHSSILHNRLKRKKMSTLKLQNALCVFLAFTLKEIQGHDTRSTEAVLCLVKKLPRLWGGRKRRPNLSSEALNELRTGSFDLVLATKTNTTRHTGWNVVYLLGKSCGMTLCV